MNNEQKNQLLASLPGLIDRTRSRSQDSNPGMIAPNPEKGGALDHPSITQMSQNDTPDELKRWAPVPRYLVAELERYGIDRKQAIRFVSCAWSNAIIGGEHARRVNP